MPEIRLLTDVITRSGESPVWDVEAERLYWIDNAAGRIFRSTAVGTEVCVWQIPRLVTSVCPRRDGGLMVTSGRRVLALDLGSHRTEDLLAPDERPELVFNDGKVDRDGRFVTGTVDGSVFDKHHALASLPPDPSGWLYRLNSDHTLMPLVGGIGITNGPCFSRDGTTLYCSDSAARCVYAFDYTTDSEFDRRVVARFDERTVPDGATVDEEDCIWVANFGGHEIRRYTPGGDLVDRVAVPVDRPTSVMFGGSDLDILFVTSQGAGHGSDGTSATPDQLGGRLLAIHGLGTRGLPERRFAG